MAVTSIYDEIKIEQVNNIRLRVEDNSRLIEDIVNQIIAPYSKDLDEYVKSIKNCLAGGEQPPTNDELEDYCMNLSTLIYFAGGMCEQLGIRDDISKAVWKETYNSNREAADRGTVQDKNTAAELASQQEQLTNICYSRAYKIMKSKVDAAQELLASCKKSLSHRMQEMELTRMMGGT